MIDQKSQAAKFHALHKDFLILPNAWDAASARLMQEIGAPAIATSSAGLAWSHGYADGHHLPIAKLVVTVEEIARVVSLPISVDSEAGYADDPKQVSENVTALIRAGAIGINLEDGTDAHEVHLKKIAEAREAAERTGVDLYINARTDVYLKKLVPAEKAVAESIRRGQACLKAGASGVFVPGLSDPNAIREVAAAIPAPLNIMGIAGAPKAAELKALGARRLSAGGRPFHIAMAATQAAAERFLRDGDSDALSAAAGKPLPWNDLFKS